MTQARSPREKKVSIDAKDLGTPEDVAKKLREVQLEASKAVERAGAEASTPKPCVNAATGTPTSTQAGGTVFVRQSSGAVPVELPGATGSQDFYVVREVAGATVSCSSSGATVQGAAAYSLPAGVGAYHFRSAGRKWWLVV